MCLKILTAQDMQLLVLNEIETHETKNIDKGVSDNREVITLYANKFNLEITINDNWVGYDFTLDSSLTHGIIVGDSLNTDLYPLDYNRDITEKIFKDVLLFVGDLLTGKLYYGHRSGLAFFAKPDHENGGYILKTFNKGLLNTGILSTVTTERKSQEDVEMDTHLQRLGI